MFAFNNERLVYLLTKIKQLLDVKVDKVQLAIKTTNPDAGGLTVIAAGAVPAGSQISLDDPRIVDSVVEGDTVILVNGVLSQENLTKPEKDILADLIEKGGLLAYLKEVLDCEEIEIIPSDEYEFRLIDTDNPLLNSKLYIVKDGRTVALLLDEYAKQESIDLLEENKLDKEVFKVETGTSLTIVSSDFIPGDGEIAADDPRIKDLVDAGKFGAGDHIDITYKTLNEENYTEEFKAFVDTLKDESLDNLLFKDDVVDSLESDVIDLPLSANQGRIIKKDFFDNIEYKYTDISEYGYQIVTDTSVEGALTIVEKDAVDGQITVLEANDLMKADSSIIFNIGDIIAPVLIDPEAENHNIENAQEAYGLDAEQVEILNYVYKHTFIDLDSMYASKKEIYDTKVNNKGKSFPTFAERLFEIDDRLQTLSYNLLNISNDIEFINAYGVYVNFEEQEFERILNAKNMVQSDFNSVYPWAGIRRCNVKNGVVMCYEGEEGYIEDGSNGDVMVEIPKFYYKVVPVRLEASATNSADQQIVEAKWMIAPRALESFKVHPAFVRGGVEVDHIYIGAFEACLYDTSASAFVFNDAQVMDVDADTLNSIIDAKPASGTTQQLSLVNSRKLAKNKGAGYSIIDFTVVSAIQMLLLIEYASFDSQTCIEQGIVNIADDGSNTNQALNTGSSQAVVYRGIENLWGNIWKYIDGINIDCNGNHYAYWSNDNYVSDTNSGYNKINFKLCCTNGYADRFGYDADNDFVFLPTRATGSSAIAANDYYWQNNENSGWTIGRLGGCYTDSVSAGCFYWCFSSSSTNKDWRVGSRIAFHKTN